MNLPIAPVLETERLRLRPLVLSDFDAYVALWREPAVVRYITGTPVTREASWSRLVRTAGHWQLLGFGFLGIEDKASGCLIGEAGFQEMRRELVPSIEETLETGWGILPAYHGKGYAFEAVGAALAWAREAHPGRAYTCIIHPENQASVRLAGKLGFAEDVTSTYLGNPVVILRRPAP